jgi:hypothetical protein
VNKNTKIWLNYLAGGVISLFLLWSIYNQVKKQVSGIQTFSWDRTGPDVFIWLSISFMFVNTSLEGLKWHLLSRAVQPLSYFRAFSSYLSGVAISIITPNRIGEYPARIFYLSRTQTFRYINVSILGIMSQWSAVYLFGLAGLIYYNIAFPAVVAKVALAGCLIVNVLLAIVYWRFEAWLPSFGKIRILRRFSVYGRLLNRVTTRRQITILGISLLRFSIFTAQYLFLLRWMNVDVPFAGGFCMAALFFWIMAVIPSIALTELGVRGTVSLFLFQQYSANDVGILAATCGIWLLNLIVPSVAGSILLLRMKLLR